MKKNWLWNLAMIFETFNVVKYQDCEWNQVLLGILKFDKALINKFIMSLLHCPEYRHFDLGLNKLTIKVSTTYASEEAF